MKSLALHFKYSKLRRIAKIDEHTFQHLMSSSEDSIYIVPVQICTTLACVDFAIGPHQIFYSDGKMYLAFNPIMKLRKGHTFFCYNLSKAHHQEDYFCLLACMPLLHMPVEDEASFPIQTLILPHMIVYL